MIFQKEHIEKILNGEKTQTRRVNRGKYRIGYSYAIQPCRTCKGLLNFRIVIDMIYQELPSKWKNLIERGDIKPESIYYPIKYLPISKEDAIAEGGYTPDEFERKFEEINPKWNGSERYIFKFHLLRLFVEVMP